MLKSSPHPPGSKLVAPTPDNGGWSRSPTTSGSDRKKANLSRNGLEKKPPRCREYHADDNKLLWGTPRPSVSGSARQGFWLHKSQDFGFSLLGLSSRSRGFQASRGARWSVLLACAQPPLPAFNTGCCQQLHSNTFFMARNASELISFIFNFIISTASQTGLFMHRPIRTLRA